MGLMFATRHPTANETRIIRALLSTYRDGSGNQREADGSTRASWREIERCISEAVNATGGEDKQIFDVIAPDEVVPNLAYGFSIKSKQLSRNTFLALPTSGRVYMEVANSPAKFWEHIRVRYGFTEREFVNMEYATEIGGSVLELVSSWHHAGKTIHEAMNPGGVLDLQNSRYVCVSYSKEARSQDRFYQIHSFSLNFPAGVIWKYKSPKCLTGYDPAYPLDALFDWYGTSGGQLKYYPRATSATYQSEVFQLLTPPNTMTLRDRASLYFPGEF